MPDHVFFEKTVLQRKFGDQLLQVAHLLAQTFNLARGRLAPGVAGEPLLATSRVMCQGERGAYSLCFVFVDEDGEEDAVH